ncbi:MULTISPECIES: hypothetical protein [unclassified Aureispira]|uniref:hypothetical protein n=1 Tax=unclassified Aureispira TaxID=2649989 RepID=UPI00069910F4|nr:MULTISPECIES: hypothetical protein [unclassified Aureispira]WMX13297.1 hypothetical protein QP953_20855 [Aureispira sp. CCB-E]
MLEPIDPNTEFIGQSAFNPIFAKPNFIKKNLLKMLEEEGIADPKLEEWYKLDILIRFYKRIEREYGVNTIFELGKSAADEIVTPEGLETLDKFLEVLGPMYDMNHRNGYAGYFKCIEHNKEEKKVIIETYTPYVNDGLRGLFISFIRLYKTGVRVVRDEEKSTIVNGVENNWYIVSYH